MAILSVVLAQMATYDTCETQWAVALAAVDVRGATWRPTRRCTPPECAPTAAAAPSPALDLDVETSIVDDDETRETAPLSPAASSEAVVSPKGWLTSWLWGKD